YGFIDKCRSGLFSKSGGILSLKIKKLLLSFYLCNREYDNIISGSEHTNCKFSPGDEFFYEHLIIFLKSFDQSCCQATLFVHPGHSDTGAPVIGFYKNRKLQKFGQIC